MTVPLGESSLFDAAVVVCDAYGSGWFYVNSRFDTELNFSPRIFAAFPHLGDVQDL